MLLNKCLASIYNQTTQLLEIICVEDKEKRGAPWARNRGLEKAHGEAVFFCDADVTLKPDCLYTLLTNFEECHWTYCNYMIGDELHRYEPFDINILKRRNICSTMSLIRRECCPMWDESIERFQDWDLFLNMALDGYKGKWIDKVLFTTPKRNGISTKGNKRAYKKIIREKWRV